jgi:hypothetical protein
MVGEIQFQKLVLRVSGGSFPELHFLETADSQVDTAALDCQDRWAKTS